MHLPMREYLPPVLIVDDDQNDVDLLRGALTRAGVRNGLLAFTNSAEALEFLRSLSGSPEGPFLWPCAMFLDLNMPNVHGFVFLKWVRSESVFDDVKVVVLSGSEKPDDRDRALKLGADQYLVKFPPPEAFAEVVACLTQRTAQR